LSAIKADIQSFLTAYGAIFVEQSDRIAHYFQISVYHDVVRFYENSGYSVAPQNLQGGTFCYKIMTWGHPYNFSYFTLVASEATNLTKREFEIHFNLSTQLWFEPDAYVAPDVVVVEKGGIQGPQRIGGGAKTIGLALCKHVQTFCEAKHNNAFPELLISFVGMLHEIKNDAFKNAASQTPPWHLAPSLMTSGGLTYNAGRIRDSLVARFEMNCFTGLFYKTKQVYAKKYLKGIRKVGST
jgi:hypothetical protein